MNFCHYWINKVLVIGTPFFCLGFIDCMEKTLKNSSIVTLMKHIRKKIIKTNKDEENWS